MFSSDTSVGASEALIFFKWFRKRASVAHQWATVYRYVLPVLLNFASYQSISIEGFPLRSSASGYVSPSFGLNTNSGAPRESRTRCAWVSAMSSATPSSGWQVVKHWRNEVPQYSMPARNVSATVFFSLCLPGVAAPNTFMSLPPSIGVESEFWPPVLE